MLQRALKPWFVYRPSQLVRRAIAGFSHPVDAYVPLHTSWGAEVIANPSRVIGRSIITTGLYDLAVSEALARLISPGDTVVDAGANVGYMTILAGIAAGPNGRILSFEPHPGLFDVLQRNVASARARLNVGTFEPHQLALGDQPCMAELQLPPDFETNDAIARIDPMAPPGGRSVTVRVATLDEMLGSSSAAAVKLDVEGFEPQVLKGAARALAEHRIRHVVFEEHSLADSETVQLFRAWGYHLFALGWSLGGLNVQPIELGSLAKKYQAPNYIATVAPDDVLARCRARGWLTLSSRFAKRRQ